MKKTTLWGFLFVLISHSVSANDVVLTAPNGVTITEKDIENYVEDRVPLDKRAGYFASPKSMKELVESLFVVRSAALEGRKVAELKHDLVEWQAAVHKDRLTMAYYLDYIAEQRLSKVNWDETARDVYRAEKSSFVVPEAVNASHILVSLDGRSEEQALARAEEALNLLKEGKSFKAIAVDYSDDPSVAKNFGNLGWFSRGRMVKPFEDAVFSAAQPGLLSSPVKTDFGYHVIRVDDFQVAKERSFEDVKDEIIDNLKTEIAKKAREEKLIAIRSTSDLKLNTELMEDIHQSLRERYKLKPEE
ncbi:peptidylprolyl isomerase [Neptunomonas marina]|uniref:peptidylprolyl isomerase n=1 Tax=Neptunomonas marina TaxID=1815562 RepID=A0A437Q746_9GAMM|nr:peptidylprolyl isomerase [Neptunomonas marina]RVU30316.1 hypothetical protein EOE65_11770 [Neptunomonas marina]